MERIRIIFAKEVQDNLRDRRTLSGALIYPLLGPILMALVFTVAGHTVLTQSENPLPLPVVGAEAFTAGNEERWLGRVAFGLVGPGTVWLDALSLQEAQGGPELFWEADVNRPLALIHHRNRVLTPALKEFLAVLKREATG